MPRSGQPAEFTGASRAANFTGGQAEAEAAMRAAGIRPPRACGCLNPAHHTDYEGDTTCIYCGRAPRGLR